MNKICTLFLLLITLSSFSLSYAEVPRQSSIVYTEGKRLMVQKRLADGSLAQARPYIIKGMVWQPATRAPAYGPNPLDPSQTIPYGFFFEWWNVPGDRNPPGHEIFIYWMKNELLQHYQVDIAKMKEMNVNTVRLYIFGDEPAVYDAVLNELYRNGIMAIMTVAASKEELENGRHLQMVQLYKDHPAILMWLLGNEWNLEYNKYYGYATVEEAARATERAAQMIKGIDVNHPVSSCLGDRFDDPVFSNTIAYIVNICPDVDVWGLNIYRGAGFGDLFSHWQQITPKPFYLGEFGIDSFHTTNYTVVNGYKADNCSGAENQDTQANFDISLWKEIGNNLSALNPNQACLGGTIMAFNDGLWQVGCYHVDLGGLVDYDGPDNLPNTPDDDTSYDEYNSEGFYMPGSFPDNVANVEYFGVADADRKPKKAYFQLKDYYGKLNVNKLPVANAGTDKIVNECSEVIVEGSGSYDPEGQPLAFSWRQISGDTLLLSGQDTAQLGFITPEVTPQQGQLSFDFELVVNDGIEDSLPDTVTVTVQDVPKPPIINQAEADRTEAYINEPISFCGKATDPDNNINYVKWVFGNGGEFSILDSSEICNYAYTYTTAGTYQAIFSVKDTTNLEAVSNPVSLNIKPLIKPSINYIWPFWAKAGSDINIFGQNFGVQDADSKVYIDGYGPAPIAFWSNDKIVFIVPKLKRSGFFSKLYKLVVVTKAGVSNPVYFLINH